MKLTAKQQEVVNLMAVGYGLYVYPDMGRLGRASSSLHRNGHDGRCVTHGIASQLQDKAIVHVSADSHLRTEYRLTPLGLSLAKPIEKKTLTTWYRIGKKWDTSIVEEQFAGSTDAYLIRENGRGEAKDSKYYTYFETRGQAIGALRARLEREVKSKQQQLSDAQSHLEQFNERYGC